MSGALTSLGGVLGGTSSGPTTVIALNGSTQYCTCAAPFHGATTMTAAIWAKYVTLIPQNCAFAVWDDVGGGNIGNEWIITTASGTELLVGVRNSQFTVPHGGTLTTGAWIHLCLQYDGTTLNGYINGVNVCNSTFGSGAIATTSASMSIGAGLNTPSFTNPFTGNLACASVWDITLTPTEIASLAAGTSSRAVQFANLKFYSLLTNPVVDEIAAVTITQVGSPTFATDFPPVTNP